MTRLVVVSAGLRSPSSTRLLADELAGRAAAALAPASPDAVTTEVVEVRELAHEIADALLTGFAAGRLREALDTVVRADALVVVTPTFSGSYSGLFKSFFDVVEPGALAGIPVVLAATGGSERHSLMLEHALRPLFVYLKAVPVPTAVYAATSDFGGGAGDGADAIGARVDRAARELAALVAGSGPSRRPEHPGEPEFTPFEELLKR